VFSSAYWWYDPETQDLVETGITKRGTTTTAPLILAE